MLRAALTVVVALGALGCGDDGDPPGVDAGPVPPGTDAGPGLDAGPLPPGTDAGPPAADAGPAELPDAGRLPIETVTLEAGPYRAARTEEQTLCVTKRLPVDHDVWVRGVDVHISSGSHHMIVYRSAESEENLTPRRCDPFVDILGGGGPIVLAQNPEAAIRFPEGTAMRLAAGQLIRLELHFINYFSDSPIDVTASVDFHTVPVADIDLDPVDYIFAGPVSIRVDPRSEGEASIFHRITASPESPVYVFGVSSHMHQWGELATVERAAGPTGPGELLHESRSWEDPPIDTFDPPLEFTGADGLRVRCQYFNASDRRVGFGESFNDEMCFLIGMYYPAHAGFMLRLF